MIYIKRVTLKNFKIFGNKPFVANFHDNELVLFDGPNGYGKTSVFDAIELALTGNIRRLLTLENRQTPHDVVVAHNNAEDVQVILELSGTKEITILRKLKSPVPKEAKKVSRFSELWDSFINSGDKWTRISNNEFWQMLGDLNFVRNFHLFNYIQQEESAYFLKSKSEVERAAELSQLFGGAEQTDKKLTTLTLFCKRLDASIRGLTSKIELLERATGNAQPDVIQATGHFTYAPLLPWLQNTLAHPAWDKEKPAISGPTQLQTFMQELSQTARLLKHRDYFLRSRYYLRISKQSEIFYAYIKYWLHFDRYESYFIEYERIETLKKFLSSLSQLSLKQYPSDVDIDVAFNLLNDVGADIFKKQLTHLLEVENAAASFEREYSNFFDYRTGLQKFTQHSADEHHCPLCGTDFAFHDVLVSSIESHGKHLETFASNQAKQLLYTRQEFQKNHVDPIVIKLGTRLSSSALPSRDELARLREALGIKERLTALDNWLSAEEIFTVDLLVADLTTALSEDDIKKRVDDLASRIREKIGAPSEDYTDENSDGIFENIFANFFSNNKDFVLSTNESSIAEKIAYLRAHYAHTASTSTQELTKLIEERLKLRNLKDRVTRISKKVTSATKQYRKKLITDIEIPFYIYSSKLLQTHQAGVGHGVFIKDPTGGDELKNVRLVSNLESDHDVLNTMSSGQISAIVIALTLALHKVYSKQFGVILIDDPVQTMDDINMSSLVELLRNDFRGKQLILSTHEDKAARYLLYKYLKHGIPAKKINLIDNHTTLLGNMEPTQN